MKIREFRLRASGKVGFECWKMVNRARRKQFVHFLHTGKTGGTAVKTALENNRVTDEYAIILRQHKTTLKDIPRGQYVFFLLRDPAARFVSAFQARQRQGWPRHDAPWDRNEERAFAVFHTPNQLARALSSDDEILRQQAVHAMNSIKHLRQSYRYWFGTDSYFLSRLPDIALVGFQETLAADFEQLKIKLGLPPDLELPHDPIASNRAPTTDNTELDEIAICNLKKWYAQDYAFVALCTAICDGINAREILPEN